METQRKTVMEFFGLWVFHQSEPGVEIATIGKSVCIEIYIYSEYIGFSLCQLKALICK